MNDFIQSKARSRWRQTMFEVIFESDTPAGKWFDIVLIICILLSVVTVMLDSVSSIRARCGGALTAAEWFFTILADVCEFVFLWQPVSRDDSCFEGVACFSSAQARAPYKGS